MCDISLQTFAIPGSISLSILSGFLFPFPMALILVCTVSHLANTLFHMLPISSPDSKHAEGEIPPKMRARTFKTIPRIYMYYRAQLNVCTKGYVSRPP